MGGVAQDGQRDRSGGGGGTAEGHRAGREGHPRRKRTWGTTAFSMLFPERRNERQCARVFFPVLAKARFPVPSGRRVPAWAFADIGEPYAVFQGSGGVVLGVARAFYGQHPGRQVEV